MTVIRTFVAVLIAEGIRERISSAQLAVKQLAPKVNWVVPENFHVTLKFLGNIREDQLHDICSAVETAVDCIDPFEISFSGLGAFPSPRNARVVWAGIKDGAGQLSDLAGAVENELAKLGFEREDRPFRAHVTIGRVKDTKSIRKLPEGLREANAQDFGTQRVESVCIMQSELSREGPKYSPLGEVKLLKGNE